MFLLIVIVLGVIVGAIAKSKGRSFVGWFIYGALIFIVAIIHVLLIGYNGKKCPNCAEYVKREAWICHFCGGRFT